MKWASLSLSMSMLLMGSSISAPGGCLPSMRQQLFQSMVRLRVNARQHVTQVGPRIQALSSADCTRLITTAERCPANSLPTNSQFEVAPEKWSS